MCFTNKNRLTRVRDTGYKIERVYKIVQAFSWNPSIFGGFFLSASPFHAAGGVF